MKQITFDPMPKLLKGFDAVADAVTGTLGPKGRNVFIDDPAEPLITNDGATIAKNILLQDPIENMGGGIVRNTASQTNDDAGDGTTTTAVLLQSIVHESLKRPENPMEIRESLKIASAKTVKEIKKNTIKMKDSDIERIALVSAENQKLASLIAEVFVEIGNNAVITIEDSYDGDISYEIVDGYECACGFLSPAFANEKNRARCVMTDVPIFVSEKKISTISDISPLFEQLKAKGISSAVIVCEDIDNPILGVFVASKMAGTFNAVVIRATGDVLKDIEAVTGAKRVSDTTGLAFADVKIEEHLGRVKKIVVDANKSLFIPFDTGPATLWANHLQKFANEERNIYIKDRLNKRISQLRGGVAVLKIGSPTDFERVDLKLKAEDAVKAVKAALEEGTVEGGGMTLWRIAEKMKPKTIGEEILKRVLTSPLRKIIENTGKDYAEIVKNLPEGKGYDAKNDKYVDMIESGIIDPAKVERCALENAVSSASEFITTFATVSEYTEPKK